MGDRFNMRLYDDVTEDMMLDGWVDHDVTPELAKEVFTNLKKRSSKNNSTVPCKNFTESGQSYAGILNTCRNLIPFLLR